MPALPDDFILQHQHGDNLCWLSVGASVDDFHTGTAGGRDQCDMAQRLIANLPSGTTCCPASGIPLYVPPACDKAGAISDAIKEVGHYGSESTALAAFADIESEILTHNPVALALEYSDGTNHAVAVVDAYSENGNEILVIDDPADLSRIYYDYGSSDLGGQWNIRWLRTFFTTP